VTGETARRELREARAKGSCGWCGATAAPGKLVSTAHNRPCKIVTDAGIRRRPRGTTR
jgi:hypothetical protein